MKGEKEKIYIGNVLLSMTIEVFGSVYLSSDTSGERLKIKNVNDKWVKRGDMKNVARQKKRKNE